MASTFGERLKSARKSKNLTQKELALKIGAKHNSISDWENNKNKPDPDTIELLCGVLAMSPNYLLGSSPNISISPAENDLLNKYRTLDAHGKRIVDMVLDEEYSRCENATSVHLMPVAAHNDHADDPEELERMKRDLDKL